MTYQSYAKEKKGERKRDLGINRKTNVLFRSPDDVFFKWNPIYIGRNVPKSHVLSLKRRSPCIVQDQSDLKSPRVGTDNGRNGDCPVPTAGRSQSLPPSAVVRGEVNKEESMYERKPKLPLRPQICSTTVSLLRPQSKANVSSLESRQARLLLLRKQQPKQQPTCSSVLPRCTSNCSLYHPNLNL